MAEGGRYIFHIVFSDSSDICPDMNMVSIKGFHLVASQYSKHILTLSRPSNKGMSGNQIVSNIYCESEQWANSWLNEITEILFDMPALKGSISH